MGRAHAQQICFLFQFFKAAAAASGVGGMMGRSAASGVPPAGLVYGWERISDEGVSDECGLLVQGLGDCKYSSSLQI